jgi:hypothetical protein
MTVRIGNAVRSGQPWDRSERSARESFPDSEPVTPRRTFSRHRLVWRFAPQPGRKPKS